MLAATLIIFREIFEIVLIVGIILAATTNLPGRMKWIIAGFAGGLLGSGLVALFTEQISNVAEGLGQELFNAGILATAALFIGWTVLWMQKHAREMKSQFKQLGQDIAASKLPFYALSAVIAVTMLREGSEIVLFSYGMIASGASIAGLAGGALLGTILGLTLGLLIYKGLIKLPVKYFFRVTSILLILLVAGMAAQSVGFLHAAGYLENLTHTVWDSSWLIEDGSWLGQSLHALIGYTSMPTAGQLMIYVAVLSFFWLVSPSKKNVLPPYKKTPVTP